MPGVVSPSITQTANGVNLYQPANAGNTDVVPNLAVTGNATVGGTLAVTGATTLSSVSASGAMTCGSLSTPGVVSAGTLSSSGGVNAVSVTASGAVSGGSVSGGTVSATTSVSASVFNNNTVNGTQTVQIVTDGVASGGASFGGSTAVMQIPLLTLFPQMVNFKVFQLFISGSATDRFSTIVGAYSGASTTGVYASQLQNVTTFDATRNIRGGLQPLQYTAPSGGDAITMYPDNMIISASNLTSANNNVFYCVTASNSSTIAWNRTTPGQSTNVWITFVGLL